MFVCDYINYSTCKPIRNITFYLNGKEQFINESGNTWTKRFTNVRKSGTYSCGISNIVGKSSPSQTVSISIQGKNICQYAFMNLPSRCMLTSICAHIKRCYVWSRYSVVAHGSPGQLGLGDNLGYTTTSHSVMPRLPYFSQKSITHPKELIVLVLQFFYSSKVCFFWTFFNEEHMHGDTRVVQRKVFKLLWFHKYCLLCLLL
jgi:hypothetical protein